MYPHLKKRAVPLVAARPKPKERTNQDSADVRSQQSDTLEFMHRHDGVLRVGGVPLVKGLR